MRSLIGGLGVAVALSMTNAGAARGDPAGVEMLDVRQAAERIERHSSRPSVVLLYSTTCSLSEKMFPEFVSIANNYRARGVDFLVFSTDSDDYMPDVPAFLVRHRAQFPAMAIRPWPDGHLSRAMAPLGIKIGTTWTRPLVAVRDRTGKTVAQGQAVTDLRALRKALDAVTR